MVEAMPAEARQAKGLAQSAAAAALHLPHPTAPWHTGWMASVQLQGHWKAVPKETWSRDSVGRSQQP
ncbi:unnamed protein product [Merluccius merluccius]